MSFKDEFDMQQRTSSGGFFKFKRDGQYKFRIMCEPVKKVSRFGTNYGICYEGAPYCQQVNIDADYKAKIEEAKKAGKSAEDIKKIKPALLNIKWMVWAFVYDKEEKEKKFLETGQFEIFDMSNPVASALRELMDSDEYGFKEFPMPYDITITVKDAGKTTVEYFVTAARKNTEISEDVMTEYSKLTPMVQIKERLENKQKAKIEGTDVQDSGGVDYPEEEIDPNDIPF
jgi:hypothetical protein